MLSAKRLIRRRLMRPRNLAGLIAAAAIAVTALGDPAALPWPGVAKSSSAPAPATQIDEDLEGLLAQVQVVDRIGEVPGYDRSCKKGHGCVFGAAWNDPNDHSGCDTRARVMGAAMREVVYKPGTRNCKVVSGILDDPYTGETIIVSSDPAELQADPDIVALSTIQVDHIVPLAAGWDAGAYAWTQERRVQFANDTSNLIPVPGSVNASKSDSRLGEWRPPNPAYSCGYSIRYVRVSAAYGLPITTADRDTALRACGGR